MNMPTSLAILPEGGILVADGVNDCIIQFDSNGVAKARIRSIGEEKLSRPVGVAVGPGGRWWIADTGRARVLVRRPDGALDRVIQAPSAAGDKTPELTDLALSPDGRFLWIVDNHNHRLIRCSLESGVQDSIGRAGEALGQFNHPFMIALNGDGSAFITDVLNGRINRFNNLAQPQGSISTYGVDLGEVYRPKGIACDGQGRVWVSDSVLGVLQVFDAEGRFFDVLRGEDGQPLHFDSPMGLAFDRAGYLFVTELGKDQVVRIEITHSPAQPSPPQSPRTRLVGSQARGCTVCHLEWMEPLANQGRTELISAPDNPPDHPYVSRSETCLSCHDASVVDSRRMVWQEHGHRTDVTPPASMKVPKALPLVDGKIACRTCHSAHANNQFQSDVATAVFLRAENSAGELCIGCHADKTRGPSKGTHPTGGMPWAIPRTLIAAGAKPGPNPRELTCTVCHTPHGSLHDHLLVMGTGSNQLCMTCHDQMRPGMFRDGSHTEHPISPVANAEQRAAVENLGTKLGDGERVICLSCHKLHHGHGEHFMLAGDLSDGSFCLACHSDKRSVVGGLHDLRVRFGGERNRLGMTPDVGGPCSACHLFHRYARSPEISDLDPGGGKCITCHEPGGCANDKVLSVANHPRTPCVACHDPHRNNHPPFLQTSPAELCSTCHPTQAALAGGPHDRLASSASWPEAALNEHDRCMSCHRPHGDARTGLFRVPPSTEAYAQADNACLACHPASAWGAHGADAALHAREVPRDWPPNPLPLVSSPTGPAIGCKTCHNPHAADGAVSRFARVEPGRPATALCATCHPNAAPIDFTAHRSSALAGAGFDARSCGPCHEVHGSRDAIRQRLLWPRSLVAADGSAPETQACLACHRVAGAAPTPTIATHPSVDMMNVSDLDSAGFLPLFDAAGRIDPQGAITCQTCHVPHGRWPDSRWKGSHSAADRPPDSHGMRLMLRPFAAPNLCTTCHGADGLRRFLYFHDPQRRKGPLTDPAADGGNALAAGS